MLLRAACDLRVADLGCNVTTASDDIVTKISVARLASHRCRMGQACHGSSSCPQRVLEPAGTNARGARRSSPLFGKTLPGPPCDPPVLLLEHPGPKTTLNTMSRHDEVEAAFTDLEAIYTAFPDLRGHKASPKSSERPETLTSCSLADLECSLDVLTAAWAHLLFYNCGVDRPVFDIDSCPVRFDIASKKCSRVTTETRPLAAAGKDWSFPERGAECLKHEDQQALMAAQRTQEGFAVHLHHPPSAPWTLDCSELVPASHVPQIARQLRTIVRWLTRSCQAPISWHDSAGVDLAMLNPHPRRMEGPGLLHDLPHSGNSTTVDAVDHLDPDGTRHRLSYAALQESSDAFALHIRQILAGLDATCPGNQQIIPVLLPQGPDLYIALLGVLKAGAAFCPFDLDVPQDRIRYVLDDVGARVVVTNIANQSKFSFSAAPVVVLPSAFSSCPVEVKVPGFDPSPKDLAYVMYTSGSTGTPKGVGVSHFAITQSLLAHNRHVPSFSRFLQFAAPAFDVFVFEVFFPLFRGRTLVGCDRESLLGDLPGVLQRMEIDAAELTPTVAAGLLRRREDAPGLKVLLTIGELLTRPIVESFGGSSAAPAVLHGMYGPTEAAVHCTLVSAMPAVCNPATIGVPLDTVSAFVVPTLEPGRVGDEPLRPLPVGHVGELAIGGHQLADGYLNNPEKTSLAFMTDARYGRYYRTGDKARLLPSGNLEYLGRINSGQVKLRGQRVELGEIDEVVLKVPGISSATTIVIGGILTAFCVTDNDAGAVTRAAFDQCRRWLPGYMIPGDVVLLRAFPRLASGKVDKKALEESYESTRLRSQDGADATSQDADNAKWSEVELEIRRAFSNVSRVPVCDISRSTTIFQLGIDSLDAVKVVTELKKSLRGVSLAKLLEVRLPFEVCDSADQCAVSESTAAGGAS